MHRFSTEILVTAIASAIMLAGVLLAGTAIAQPAARTDDRLSDEHGTCQERSVTALAASAVEGWSRLCLDGTVVRPTVHVSGLTPGHIYTAWLAYFDRPATCAQAPCGLVDLRGENPVGVLGRVGGGLPAATGGLELRAELHDLVFAPGAQVSLLLLYHGPANVVDTRTRARQILTAETPAFRSLGLGTTVDGQKAFPHAQAVFAIQ